MCWSLNELPFFDECPRLVNGLLWRRPYNHPTFISSWLNITIVGEFQAWLRGSSFLHASNAIKLPQMIASQQSTGVQNVDSMGTTILIQYRWTQQSCDQLHRVMDKDWLEAHRHLRNVTKSGDVHCQNGSSDAALVLTSARLHTRGLSQEIVNPNV